MHLPVDGLLDVFREEIAFPGADDSRAKKTKDYFRRKSERVVQSGDTQGFCDVRGALDGSHIR